MFNVKKMISLKIIIIILFIGFESYSIAGLTHYQYDNLHRLTRVEYSNGTVTTYEYDALGNRTQKTIVTGITCSYSITPVSEEFDFDGGNLDISIDASDESCSWTVSENLLWVEVSPDSGTGDGSVTLTVAANTGSSRSGIVTIGGEEFDISQTNNPSPQIFVLADSPLTIEPHSYCHVYGNTRDNVLTIGSGASVELINFPGSNTITIQSDLHLFTVRRSGSVVILEGTDGTVVRIPATATSQSIVFNDGSLTLIISSGQVVLGEQVVVIEPILVNMTSSGDDTITNSLGMTFVRIEPGTFMMGAPPDELSPQNYDWDRPQHRVTLTQPFYIQTTEVTQSHWEAVMGNNPSYYDDCGGDCPVEFVSWDIIQEFIKELDTLGEGSYALPTEAQWEYAARAGSTTAFANGDITNKFCDDPNLDAIGWYCGNDTGMPSPVAQKEPNAWGLYDMHGSVAEWCQDWYDSYSSDSETDPEGPTSGYSRIVRGGSRESQAWACRSASRHSAMPPGYIHNYTGFRLVFSPSQY